MIEIGKRQSLNVVNRTEFGVYLGIKDEKVLLPIKQVPADIEEGDALEVFVYRDSSDRLIATTKLPKIELGQIKKLKVVQITQIGAFLDWGLEKDLFLPFKEQSYKVNVGDECLVVLYVDKSDRLCASMRRVYNYLENYEDAKVDDIVSGTVIEMNPDYGAYVAVEDKYYGMIQKNEIFDDSLKIGATISARISKIRDDKKLMLSLRKKAYLQMDDDAKKVFEEIEKRGGKLPFTDKASPELIKSQFNMSKNEFKRAIGRLLKEKKIVIEDNSIKIIK